MSGPILPAPGLAAPSAQARTACPVPRELRPCERPKVAVPLLAPRASRELGQALMALMLAADMGLGPAPRGRGR